jgi:hypothetical protein
MLKVSRTIPSPESIKNSKKKDALAVLDDPSGDLKDSPDRSITTHEACSMNRP